MKDKQNYLKIIILFFALIALETFDGLGVSSTTIKVIRLGLGLLIITFLSQKLTNKQDKTQNYTRKSLDGFEMKFTTYIIASPDDVASHLTEISTRKAWDPNLK